VELTVLALSPGNTPEGECRGAGVQAHARRCHRICRRLRAQSPGGPEQPGCVEAWSTARRA